MRRILVDNARRRSRAKRGGDRRRVSLDAVELTLNEPPDDLIALDEALAAFAERQPEKAQLVKLRYFAGLTNEEAAQALGISTSTADRHWAYAKAWLYRRVRAAGEPRGPSTG
jgi:RNA polymerase sigma factor (TIGR02999 family)